MPRPKSQDPKVRVNIMIRPELLKRIDDEAGKYERSVFIGEACAEKLERAEAEK